MQINPAMLERELLKMCDKPADGLVLRAVGKDEDGNTVFEVQKIEQDNDNDIA